jgi:hypothetical protein
MVMVIRAAGASQPYRAKSESESQAIAIATCYNRDPNPDSELQARLGMIRKDISLSRSVT